MFSTLSRSFKLVRESFEVLKKDKEMLLFPLLGGILTIILFVGGFSLTLTLILMFIPILIIPILCLIFLGFYWVWVAVMGIIFIVLILIGSSLDGIFRTALYIYASSGEVPQDLVKVW